jgi:hypothetical protein
LILARPLCTQLIIVVTALNARAGAVAPYDALGPLIRAHATARLRDDDFSIPHQHWRCILAQCRAVRQQHRYTKNDILHLDLLAPRYPIVITFLPRHDEAWWIPPDEEFDTRYDNLAT